MHIKDSNIAIVHDWFMQKSFGGSEKVTFTLNNFFNESYSNPDIFSLTSNIEDSKINNFGRSKIYTSFIQSLPFGKTNVQSYLPFLPYAVEQLDLRKYDLIISSSHAFAKGILTSPDQLHISYVHTPMRYAWDQMYTYLEKSTLSKLGFEFPIRLMLYKLREWDFYSSQRLDYIISNSNFTSKRIKKYWGLESEVIHPPVDIKRFKYENSREDFYLSLNRLVPNKRVDLLIKAFNKLNLPLIIIGDGPERLKLEKIANCNIKFLRKISDREVEKYMSRCKAFVYAGIEDFGIAPVEAMASGAPVIAYGKGGILDTVNCLNGENTEKVKNGLLFKKQTAKDIIDTISWFEDKKLWRKFKPENLNEYSQNFSIEKFLTKFDFSINKAWEIFKKKF
ncbi:MAG: glycosyltransferase [Prochlorococcus marinus XMU1422]|nr:glycosyltransferase [Prochlorococcus marinus XMU1421]MBO7013232.1 glycosyltransferase [Prochlorococcus marinus XMU1422]MCR8542313.1 glycosyltransferase [Prochlorococcus marinus XMU1423]